MENQNFYVINVGLNVGLNDNLRVNEDKLSEKIANCTNLIHTIKIRLNGELYTTYHGTKVEEDTNIYIFKQTDDFNMQKFLQYLCNTFGQICITYKKYDTNLIPVYSGMCFSKHAKKEEKEIYMPFNNEYFCNPFKF